MPLRPIKAVGAKAGWIPARAALGRSDAWSSGPIVMCTRAFSKAKWLRSITRFGRFLYLAADSNFCL